MSYQWRELKKLWKELINGDKSKINKKQKESGWTECLDGDEFIATIAEYFDVLWPWLVVVDIKKYSIKSITRHELTQFGENWSFPMNFTDSSTGRWMAIVWGCHLSERKPTFEEYFSAVKACRATKEIQSYSIQSNF